MPAPEPPRMASFGALTMLVIQFVLGTVYSLHGTAPTSSKSIGMFSSPLLRDPRGHGHPASHRGHHAGGARGPGEVRPGPRTSVTGLVAILGAFGAGSSFTQAATTARRSAWPWPRGRHARYSANLVILGPRRQVGPVSVANVVSLGAAAAGDPGRGSGRRRDVPVAMLPAARPRLPVVRDRHVAGRRGGRRRSRRAARPPARGRGRVGTRRGRGCCSSRVLGGFRDLRTGARRAGATAARAQPGADPGAGRLHDPARAAVRRGVRPVHVGGPDRQAIGQAARRAGRRATARRAVRRRLVAVPRADPRGRPDAVGLVGDGGARGLPRVRLRAGPRHPVPAGVAGVPADGSWLVKTRRG